MCNGECYKIQICGCELQQQADIHSVYYECELCKEEGIRYNYKFYGGHLFCFLVACKECGVKWPSHVIKKYGTCIPCAFAKLPIVLWHPPMLAGPKCNCAWYSFVSDKYIKLHCNHLSCIQCSYLTAMKNMSLECNECRS